MLEPLPLGALHSYAALLRSPVAQSPGAEVRSADSLAALADGTVRALESSAPGLIGHPNHHDLGVWLSRRDNVELLGTLFRRSADARATVLIARNHLYTTPPLLSAAGPDVCTASERAPLPVVHRLEAPGLQDQGGLQQALLTHLRTTLGPVLRKDDDVGLIVGTYDTCPAEWTTQNFARGTHGEPEFPAPAASLLGDVFTWEQLNACLEARILASVLGIEELPPMAQLTHALCHGEASGLVTRYIATSLPPHEFPLLRGGTEKADATVAFGGGRLHRSFDEARAQVERSTIGRDLNPPGAWIVVFSCLPSALPAGDVFAFSMEHCAGAVRIVRQKEGEPRSLVVPTPAINRDAWFWRALRPATA